MHIKKLDLILPLAGPGTTFPLWCILNTLNKNYSSLTESDEETDTKLPIAY